MLERIKGDASFVDVLKRLKQDHAGNDNIQELVSQVIKDINDTTVS